MSIAKDMQPIEGENLDFELHGYLCNPQITRANRSYISLLINGRYIRHHGLIQAILRGYHTLLPIHRYPIAVLSIKMDPSLVDVNVHPAKLEVRFSKEQELVTFVEERIRQVLGKQRLIPEPTRATDRPYEHPNEHELCTNTAENKLTNYRIRLVFPRTQVRDR